MWWTNLSGVLSSSKINSDELVLSIVIASLLTVLLITFFLADIAEGSVTSTLY